MNFCLCSYDKNEFGRYNNIVDDNMIFTDANNKLINLENDVDDKAKLDIDNNLDNIDHFKLKELYEKEKNYLKLLNSNNKPLKLITYDDIQIGLNKVHNNIRYYLRIKKLNKKNLNKKSKSKNHN